VYRFIEEILAQPRNNPVQAFDRYSEIEDWLRIQWAGLFRELMLRVSGQQQLATLAEQVRELAEVNKTLRRYLEEVISKVSPQEASRIIDSESERLAEAALERELRQNAFIRYLQRRGVTFEVIRSSLEKAKTLADFKDSLIEAVGSKDAELADGLEGVLHAISARPAFDDLNRARELLGRMGFSLNDLAELRNREEPSPY
jgi:hypothetical protein